jgi:hypothetical protein
MLQDGQKFDQRLGRLGLLTMMPLANKVVYYASAGSGPT